MAKATILKLPLNVHIRFPVHRVISGWLLPNSGTQYRELHAWIYPNCTTLDALDSKTFPDTKKRTIKAINNKMLSIEWWRSIRTEQKIDIGREHRNTSNNRLCRRRRGTVSITGSLLAFRLLCAFSDKQKHFLCDSRAHKWELGAAICDSRREQLNWIIHFPYVCCWVIELVSERECAFRFEFWWNECKWKWMRLCASQPHLTAKTKTKTKQCVFTATTN